MARILACAMALATVPLHRARAVDPEIEWRMLETEHFTIVYDSQHRLLAGAYAKYAEQAWAADSTIFHEWPRKTVVLLDDEGDVANGAALALPYSTIQAYPVLSTELSVLSDYGDSGFELMIHEYAHILTFEPTHGWLKPFRYVFGSLARPNGLLPRWYLEGLAVEMETRFSKNGRLRSPNFMAIPRAMVADGSLRKEDLSRINELFMPDWPGGSRAYLMGAMMWNEMIREKGDSIVGQLNDDYSRRVPFFINGPARERLGVGYEEILKRTYDRAEANARKQLAAIDEKGATKTDAADQAGFFNYGPAISPDGNRLAFVATTANDGELLETIERPKGSSEPFSKFKPRTLTQTQETQRISWLPDSSGFVYDSIARYSRWRHYGDLWFLRAGSDEPKRLSRGLRAREPAVSPDGKTIAFVQNGPGCTRIALLPIDGNMAGYRAIFAPALGVRASRPEFLSDKELLFTLKGADGLESLRRLTLAPALLEAAPRTIAEAQRAQDAGSSTVLPETSEILADFKPLHFPKKIDAGLLFVSDRSGVSNVYLAPLSLAKARAITNVETRAITPDLDPRTRDLYFSLLASDGMKLERAEATEWERAPERPPKVGPLIDYEWPRYAAPAGDPKILEDGEYRPWRWLYPHYWIPSLYWLPGFFTAQGETGSSDPVGHHQYRLGAGYDSLTSRPAAWASYVNQNTRVPALLSASDYNEYIYAGSFSRHQTFGLGSASFFLPGLDARWKGSFGWTYQQTELGPQTVVRDGPIASVSFNDVEPKRGFQISPESGGAVSIAETRFLPERGDPEYEITDVSASWYFSKGLPRRHALAFFGNATIAPRMGAAFLGRTTIGGNYMTGWAAAEGNYSALAPQSALTMRGYPFGEFFGRNMLTGTVEYRFPISYEYHGSGVTPLFWRRWHGAVFTDVATLDGKYYDFNDRAYDNTKLGSFFFGGGVEARADITAFYSVPLTLILGAYAGSEPRATAATVTPFLGIGM